MGGKLARTAGTKKERVSRPSVGAESTRIARGWRLDGEEGEFRVDGGVDDGDGDGDE